MVTSIVSSVAEKGLGDQLVEQWQAGENPEECFKRIFLHYYRPVYYHFLRHGFSGEESHDLTQDTFFRLLKNLPSFRGESRFETWLFQIATNIYRNELRDRSTLKRGAPEVSLDEILEQHLAASVGHSFMPWERGGGDSPLDDVLATEQQNMLHDALHTLPPQMRKCVLLRVQDLKYREIAEVMNVSVDTVKAHLFQARQQLKGKLADYFDDLDLE